MWLVALALAAEPTAARRSLYEGCVAPTTFGSGEALCGTIAVGTAGPFAAGSDAEARQTVSQALAAQKGLSIVSFDTGAATFERRYGSEPEWVGFVRWAPLSGGGYLLRSCMGPARATKIQQRCVEFLDDLAASGMPSWLPASQRPFSVAGKFPVAPEGCSVQGSGDSGSIVCADPLQMVAVQPMPGLPSTTELGDVCGPLVSQWPGATYTARSPQACTLSGVAATCGICSVSPRETEPLSLLAAVGRVEGQAYLVSCVYRSSALPALCGEVVSLR